MWEGRSMSWIVGSAFIGSVFALAAAVFAGERAKGPEMSLYETKAGAARMLFPKGWYLVEGFTPQGYRVMITPVQPDPAQMFQPVLIDLSKFRLITKTLDLPPGPPAQRIDRYVQNVMNQSHGRLLKQEWTTLQGLQARLVEIGGIDAQGAKHRIMLGVVVQDELLAAVLCEAPPDEFATYRPVFRRVVESLQPFLDPSVPLAPPAP